jgi:hypothetical protein
MLHNRAKTKLRFYPALMAICLTFCLVPGLAACQAISTGTPTPQGTVLFFETIEQQDYSGTGIMYESKNPGIIIVSGTGDANNLMGLISENSLKQLQTLDYQGYFVIATFQGWKPETGYGIQIDKVVRSGNTVNILVTLDEPKPPQHPGEIVSSPYHLVRIQKTGNWGQEITFNLMADDQLLTSAVHGIP